MQALGTIEVVGLAAGFEAADVAVKTANVELVGYELAKGGGYVTIKIMGQVGAVKAAVDAAAQAAARISQVVGTLVIPRPSDQLEPLVYSDATVGYHPSPVVKAPAPQKNPVPAVDPVDAPDIADEAKS